MPAEYAVIGVVAAIVLRTLLPYLTRENKGEGWNHKYTASAVIAFLIGLLTATQETVATLPPGTDALGAFLIVLVAQTGLNGLFGRARSHSSSSPGKA